MIFLFLEQFAPSCADTRLHAARIFADAARITGGRIEILKMFDALGPELNTLMSVKILFLS